MGGADRAGQRSARRGDQSTDRRCSAQPIQDAEQAQAQQLLQMMQQTAAVARGGMDVYA
jgi:hypothetical protein